MAAEKQTHETIDHDTLEPVETASARREAIEPDVENVKFDVEFRGKIIHLEAPADILAASADAYIAYEAGNVATMMKEILGKGQWNRLINAGMTTRVLVDAVFPAYEEAAGLGEG